MTMQEQCERYFRDRETGLIFDFLDRDTLKPPSDDFFKDATMEVEVPGVTPSGYWMHENFGMCTGSYMAAEILRFEQDGAKDALENVGLCLQGLKVAYEIGKQLEPGYFPKIYGRKFSIETSTDQVLYACWGMDAFYPYASEAERMVIREMIPAMVAFWVRRDYRYHYFHFFDENWQWPLVRFPALLTLARKYSDDDSMFRREYERLLEHTRKPEHCMLANAREANKPSPYETANQAWFTMAGADRLTMDVMNFTLLLRHDYDNPLADCWKNGIRTMWGEVRDSFADDGRYYSQLLYDFKTGKPRRTSGYSVDGTEFHGAKSAWSTMLARGGLLALEFCPELADDVLPHVQCVLDKLAFMDCTYYDEPERFAPGERFKTRLLSGDSVTNWLWADRLRKKWMAEH